MVDLEKGKKVCAIIDAQGFFVNHEFYPRELAIFNDDIKLCVEILQDRKRIWSENHKNTIYYQQNRIHGLPIEWILKPQTKKVVKGKNLKEFIEGVYFRVRNEEKYLFGVKNQQLKKLLIEYQIPFLDLETENIGGEYCPALKVFDLFQKQFFCLVHASVKSSQIEKNIHCAFRKAGNIWSWLTTKIKCDDLMLEIEQVIQG